MPSLKKAALLLSIALTPIASLHADNAILIGGGYNIAGSQGQIELNVKWVQQILKQSNLTVSTYFTDGNDPTPDVYYLQDSATLNADIGNADIDGSQNSAIDELSSHLEPIARLFNNHESNSKRYKNHEIDDVRGSTQADELGVALTEQLQAAPDDPTLIVYNGHGKQSKSTSDQVTLELWNNTQMTAAQLHTILDNSNAPSRFVFTQCYSGGFHRLAYANPEKGLELSSTQRCGFTAESAYRLAEGCSASVDTNDYRDYTTYFFAALNGYERNGDILGVDTDANQDGQITLREAHLYTLENAHSTDLSRSTSEDFLNSWQPWYLTWSAEKSGLPNNEYAKLFRNLAARHNIDLEGNPAKSIRTAMKSEEQKLDELVKSRMDNIIKLEKISNKLKMTVAEKWPAIVDGPFSANFQALVVSGEILQASSWVKEQTEYKSLVELQNLDSQMTNLMLNTERDLTQMQKMIEFRKLAKLKSRLYQYGSTEHIKAYESLVSCEEQPLNLSNSSANQPRSNQVLSEIDR